MTTRRWWLSIGTGLLAAVICAAPLSAQPPAPVPAPERPTGPAAPEAAVPITPADLNRIRRALETEPAVRIDDDQLRFYMQILVKRPTFAEYAKGYDFRNGPTRGGNPMTHNEFLTMVTPREMQSQVGIRPIETLQFAFTNWLGQSLIKRAFEELKNAKDEKEIQEIRDRIDRELAMLRRRDE